MKERSLKNLIYGDGHPIRERLFVLIIAIMSVSLTVIVIANVLTGSSLRDVLILIGLLALLGAIAVISIKKNRIKTGAHVISTLMVFVLLPFSFFSGGGIYGGPPIWFVFSALFIGLILVGRTKIVFLVLNLLVAGACYAVAYNHPELVHQNTTLTANLDSYITLVFISLAVAAMAAFTILIYQKESKRTEGQKKEIEALNDAQSRFFSSMSHEIRTPINTIIGLNEMILREDVSEEVAEDAANIKAASNMLLHLINDILDMSKLESGNMQLTPVVYRTGDILSELINMFWARAREKGLEFRVSVAPDVPAELIADDVRVKQILINVLNNAIKYTREGSVTLNIEAGARTGSNIDMTYTVSDTGIGIKKESIPFLFNAFKRVDEEKNRHIEGTGLGLSIVKQLVDLMGGEITVNSVYTQGSTFVIKIPQQVAGEETVGEYDPTARHKVGRAAYRSRFEAPDARVLVVDDNSSNLLVAGKLLRGTKVQVDTASSGEEALRKTLEKEYHVIFMDHMMPEMDGVECHRRIVAQTGGRCRSSKVIALTANADAESRALYEREGFDGYLTKPIEGAALEAELQRQLPAELVHSFAVGGEDLLEESMAWINTSQRKKLVAITTETSADLPRELVEKYEIAEIPYLVKTENGVFRDGIDLETNGLLDYMAKPGSTAASYTPDEKAHELFFANQLSKANNIIHLTLPSSVSDSFGMATEAAESFDNVTVLDCGHLSSGQGLMALEGCRLAESGMAPAEIAARLAETKKLIRTSFVVDNLDFLARAGQVGAGLARVTKALTIHPVLVVRKGKMKLSKAFVGSRERAWKKYIKTSLSVMGEIDRRELFITYAGITQQELRWIKEQTEQYAKFEHVYCQKASASISANCGPGTFGLLFKMKSAAE